jgi:hypothetical protein
MKCALIICRFNMYTELSPSTHFHYPHLTGGRMSTETLELGWLQPPRRRGGTGTGSRWLLVARRLLVVRILGSRILQQQHLVVVQRRHRPKVVDQRHMPRVVDQRQTPRVVDLRHMPRVVGRRTEVRRVVPLGMGHLCAC